MRNVFIVTARRTPIGKFGGALKDFTAADMGAHVVRETLRGLGLDAHQVDELIFGCARQAGSGPNVARQISWRAGIPETVPAYTVNQACGSGMKSILLGFQEIVLGNAECIVAGGAESMSRLPYYVEGARWGTKLGHQKLVDGMYRDGFLCPMSEMVMGETAEVLAEQYKISREEQDAFAWRSQQRAQKAIEACRFQDEILAVPLKQSSQKVRAKEGGTAAVAKNLSRGGVDTASFTRDEHVRFDAKIEDIQKLPPVFSKTGTVTAGNASGITDGAAALVLMSEEKVKATDVTPLARIVAHASAGVDPKIMGIGPVPAVQKLLAKTTMKLDDFDLIELNEAFAAQVLACDRELHFDHEKLNVNGGAIALGHPIGCTGARIVTTLVHEMQKRKSRFGLATLCVSGGMGLAVAVERV